MKLHTSLTSVEVFNALIEAKRKGMVTPDIDLVQFETEKSLSHRCGYLIGLGTYDKTTGPTNSRNYKNSGNYGASSGAYGGEPLWAATYDEWGWFIAEVFALDKYAKWSGGGQYQDIEDFRAKTDYKYMVASISPVERAEIRQSAKLAAHGECSGCEVCAPVVL